MATDWQALASEQAELISIRLRELLSDGQGLIRARFGVELGLRPELYPSWALLSGLAGLLGLLLLLLSWARGWAGRRVTGAEPPKASVTRTFKPEDPKKKNKKKPVNKKAQSNGHTVPEPEPVRAEEPSRPFTAPLVANTKTEKVKKTKKKVKSDVKSVQSAAAEGKEPGDGAWETKVSNREKRQQRRKDKGPDCSGSPGGERIQSYLGTPPAVSAPTPFRKTPREPLHARPAPRGDAVIAPVCPSWREEASLNGGGWANVSMATPPPMSTLEGDKWPAMPSAPRPRHPDAWGPDADGSWSGNDSRIKTEVNSVTFSGLGMSTPADEPDEAPASDQRVQAAANDQAAAELPRDRLPPAEDEWSGFNGTSVDPGSDWNAPTELWGNYEPPALEEDTAPGPPDPLSLHAKISDEEKEDAAGAAKSKKKKKKKKKTEEEGTLAEGGPDGSTFPEEQLPAPTSPEGRGEQTSEASKAAKKKVRRET